MIQFIPNQPITFLPRDTEVSECAEDTAYCQLARINDKYCFQARQTSCLPQLLCNNDFSIFGTNLLPSTTGEFYEMDDFQNWIADEDTWYWDEYSRSMCTIDGHAGSPAEWDLGLYAMSETCTYMLTFTVLFTNESETPGAFITVTLPDSSTQVISNSGTYSFASGMGTSFSFTPELPASVCIDNVSLACAGVCWDVDFPQLISMDGRGMCKVGLPGVVTVTEQNPTLVIGKYYMLVVKIENMSAGNVEFFLGTQSMGVLDNNGIYSLGGIANGDTFSYVLSYEFDGCIIEVNLYLLSQDYTLKLKDLDTDAVVKDLTSSLVYGVEKGGVIEKPDLIEACVLFDEDMLGDLIPHFVKNKVCLYLEIESPADGNIVTNSEMSVSNSASILDEWSFDGGLTFDAVQNQVILKGGTGYMKQDLLGAGYVQGAVYYVAFEIKCLDHDTVPDFDSFTMFLGTASDGSGGTPVWTSEDFPQQVGQYVFQVVGGSDGNYLSIFFDDSNGLNKVCIDKVYVRTTACKKELYQSNCILYGNENNGVEAFGGSKLFTACNEEGESMGFDWSTGFKLQARLFATLAAPTYSTAKEVTYLFSNGVRKRVYAEIFKKFDLLIHEVDEYTHDYIRTMLKCDQFFIEDGYDLENRYVCLDNEYVPEWDKRGDKAVAEARTEIQRFDNSLFNTNCR